MLDINTTKTTVTSIIQTLKTASVFSFEDIFSKDMVQNTLTKLQVPYRNTIFTPLVTVMCFLFQALNKRESLQATVSRFIAIKRSANEKHPSANTSALSQARERLPVKVIKDLSEQVAENIISKVPSAHKWRGRHTKLVDGSTLSMPDTAANQEKFPQPKSQKEGLGFPLARFVVIICFVTGVVLNFAMDAFSGKETGEHALLRQIIDTLKFGDIVLGDAYYPSYFLVCELIQRGVDFVFPGHGSRHIDFRKGERLGTKDHIGLWTKPAKPDWMDTSTYESYPASMKIREVEIINERPGFRAQKRVLVTSFLDPIEVSKQDLSELYAFRWFVELDIRYIKSVMKMDILTSKTPKMIEKEVWASLLGYNIVRGVMVDAALKGSKIPRQISFKLALEAIALFQQQGLITNKEHYNALLDIIKHKTVGNRSNRYEPRRKKRREKAQPMLQHPRDFYKNSSSLEVA